jgi:hypothetical protein
VLITHNLGFLLDWIKYGIMKVDFIIWNYGILNIIYNICNIELKLFKFTLPERWKMYCWNIVEEVHLKLHSLQIGNMHLLTFYNIK